MGRSPAIVYVAERPSVALVWRHFTHRRDTVELLLRLALLVEKFADQRHPLHRFSRLVVCRLPLPPQLGRRAGVGRTYRYLRRKLHI